MTTFRLAAAGANLRTVILFAIAFVGLNILDAQLTGTALVLGSSEMNPMATGFGSSLLLKGLISSGIAVALVLLGRGRLLKPLCVGMLVVVLWNLVAVWSWMP